MKDDQLLTTLRGVFASTSYRPPMLPSVALRTMDLLNRSSVDADQVVKVLYEDSAFAGSLLQRCRLAAFTSHVDVRSLRQAVAHLGMATVRNLMVEEALTARLFKSHHYSEALDQLRVHCTVTAHLARLISRGTSFDPELAFLCGLVHDVGIAAGLIALGDNGRGGRLAPLENAWPVLDRLHEQVASSVLTHWKLPIEVELAVSHHHSLAMGGAMNPLAAVVCLAEDLATELGRGAVYDAKGIGLRSGVDPSRLDAHTPTEIARAKLAVRIDDRQWALVRREAADLVLRTL